MTISPPSSGQNPRLVKPITCRDTMRPSAAVAGTNSASRAARATTAYSAAAVIAPSSASFQVAPTPAQSRARIASASSPARP